MLTLIMGREEKEALIYEAMLGLVSEFGFHGTSMSMVSEKSGIPMGTIYRYFDSKEIIISNLYIRLKEDLSQALLAGFNPELPFKDQFERFCRQMLAYSLEKPREIAFTEQFAHSPYLKDVPLETRQKFFMPVIQAFQDAIEGKIIKPLPLHVLQALSLDVAINLSRKHLVEKLPLDERMKQDMIQAAWEAIRL